MKLRKIFSPKSSRPVRNESSSVPASAATADDVRYCFRLLLGREPEPWEWPGHSAFVGQELTSVVSTYLNMEEFRNRRLINAVPKGIAKVELSRFSMFVSSEDAIIGKQIMLTKSYEPHVERIFRERVQAGMGVLDIGANVGYFSLLAASIVGKAGRVFAVEPSAENVKLLEANRLLNGFDQLTVLGTAATRETGTFVYFPSQSNGIVRSLERLTCTDILNGIPVFGMRLDDFVQLDVPIHFVKIDVEGFEYSALNGARSLLLKNKPVIVSEFSPNGLLASCGVTGRDYLEFLESLGYRFVLPGVSSSTPATVEEVLEAFNASGSDHIDIVAEQ